MIYDIIIVGGGPAGYAGTIAACKEGMTVALVEKEHVGGICVNWGCIPTKALIQFSKLKKAGQDITYEYANEQTINISSERRDVIVKLIADLGGKYFPAAAVNVKQGQVALENGEIIFGKNILLATGSRPRRLSFAEYDDSRIVTAKEALLFRQVPKSVAVIGSGATGMELAGVWRNFGAEVTVLEMLPNIMGNDDAEITAKAVKAFADAGIEIKTEIKVRAVRHKDGNVETLYTDKNGKEHVLITEKALVAAGIVPNSEGLGLEEAGVNMQNGYVQIDDYMETSVKGIYAAGDVTGKLALAFASSKQAMNAVAVMKGKRSEAINYQMIPKCVFSTVEAAYVGLNETQAKAQGADIYTKKVPYVTFDGTLVGEERGVVKIVGDNVSKKSLGVTMFGPDVTGRVAAVARAVKVGLSVDEVAAIVASGR